MALVLAPPAPHGIREADAFGSGHFAAPRGERLHKGVDFVIAAGEEVQSPVRGRVARLGFCYADDLSYRLVEIEANGAIVRVLYVLPTVTVGTDLAIGDTIGRAQDVSARFEHGMRNHVHLEVRLTAVLVGRGRARRESIWIDPTRLMNETGAG